MNQFQHNHTSDLSASLSCNSSISTSNVDVADVVGLEIGSEVQILVQRLLRREEFQTVISVASELMKDHPESLFLHFALGTAYSNLGQALETIHHCQRFIDIEGDETIENFKSNNLPSIKNNLGLALKDLGLLERAEEVFTSLLSRENDFVPALINYGNLLNDGARLSEAQTQFVKAIEVNPDNALAYWNLHSLSQDRDTARSILVTHARTRVANASAESADSSSRTSSPRFVAAATAASFASARAPIARPHVAPRPRRGTVGTLFALFC